MWNILAFHESCTEREKGFIDVLLIEKLRDWYYTTPREKKFNLPHFKYKKYTGYWEIDFLETYPYKVCSLLYFLLLSVSGCVTLLKLLNTNCWELIFLGHFLFSFEWVKWSRRLKKDLHIPTPIRVIFSKRQPNFLLDHWTGFILGQFLKVCSEVGSSYTIPWRLGQ